MNAMGSRIEYPPSGSASRVSVGKGCYCSIRLADTCRPFLSFHRAFIFVIDGWRLNSIWVTAKPISDHEQSSKIGIVPKVEH
jgi:hypothetical protein